jgi:DNA-binding transcriptional LysR family regulator
MDSAPITDLVALRMLRAIRDGGSMSAASRQFGFTQQAVSARMQRLESQLGLPLFLRSPRGATLAPAGVLLAEWSTEVLDAADRLRVALDALQSSAEQQLRVSASLTIAEYLVPRWLVGLRTSSPTITVDLAPMNSESVVESVRTGASDLGFIESIAVPGDLEARQIATDELVVVVAPDHPWARAGRRISIAELASTPLVIRERGSGTRRSLELLIAERDSTVALVSPAAELQSAAAVRAAAASGIGPAVLSALAVRDDIALGRLIPVKLRGERLVRPLTAVWRRDSSVLTSSQALLREVASGR